MTDHRIGLTLHKIDAIMDGDLNEIMDTLATTDRMAKCGDIRAGKRIANEKLWELFFFFCTHWRLLPLAAAYAMPMLQKEVVEKRQWATEDEMLDYFAIGHAPPVLFTYTAGSFIGYSSRAYRARLRQRSGVCSRHCAL